MELLPGRLGGGELTGKFKKCVPEISKFMQYKLSIFGGVYFGETYCGISLSFKLLLLWNPDCVIEFYWNLVAMHLCKCKSKIVSQENARNSWSSI